MQFLMACGGVPRERKGETVVNLLQRLPSELPIFS